MSGWVGVPWTGGGRGGRPGGGWLAVVRMVRRGTMAGAGVGDGRQVTGRRHVGDGGTECKPVMRWPAPCLAWPVLRVCVARSVARYARGRHDDYGVAPRGPDCLPLCVEGSENTGLDTSKPIE